MKLYFAWAENLIHYKLLKECSVSKFLESYYLLWWRSPNLTKWDDLLLDSWAFTAYYKEIQIDIKTYCDYIKNNNIQNYACLDVIWNWEKTAQNQKIMESLWMNPIPTFHVWEKKEFFEEMVNKYPYIWLWWMVPYARNWKIIDWFLSYCFSYIMKNKLKTKCHWRGMTNPKFMKKFPFYSVDSTWRLAPQKFNRMVLFKSGELVWFTSREMRTKFWIDFWKLHYKERNKISIKSYLEFEDYVTKLHQAKGMEYRL
jgi:hypothetical protein